VRSPLLPCLALALAASSCKTRPWEFRDCAPAALQQEVRTACRQSTLTNKVDALFMVDNSGSMDAMQEQLRQRFKQFLKVFHDLADSGTYVDLHIGVVTSDYGAGATGTGGGCEPSPGGQRGLLQAIGQLAQPGCQAPVGTPYIQYVFAPGNMGMNNLPMGQDLDATFTCMASVGSRGCGMEHQLESVYAALHNTSENKGFLRDDALLAIVWLTNEDDCSAPPDSDLFDPNRYVQYGYDGSYRCTRWGIQCGDPPAFPPYASSNGPLDMCVSAPNPGGAGPGKLFDIGRYIDYFSKPAAAGGVKFAPADVLLVGIDAPETPFEIILAGGDLNNGQNGKPYTECSIQDNVNLTCIPVLQHSCLDADHLGFFGDPSVRLNAVIRTATNNRISSICDSDYSAALANVANLIVSQLGECCLPDKLPADPRAPTDATQFVASCTVEDVTQLADGTVTVTEVPQCGAVTTRPCWKVQPKMNCAGLSPQSLGVTIDRGGSPPPAHTSARPSCRASL
jgi:hypothetical protein